ncbi:sensor histidine kinase [Actinoalloteichus hymeniacidonis]|uniref:histidine kinase n=1 Tax=Actinoalloteichus hymeniacidonis TaxID=340345 RepID=A0AAC9HR14_9PSEU|nr:histidine kinase [Actinoalloteichus hymeniacidonis]AOS63819.1 signal transduction histidine kinase [Actinoalloteichus hymeniacidonis]MBB5908127.1 signal transduction histidine kinase [Actinoalloteichus hymeniacidonis]
MATSAQLRGLLRSLLPELAVLSGVVVLLLVLPGLLPRDLPGTEPTAGAVGFLVVALVIGLRPGTVRQFWPRFAFVTAGLAVWVLAVPGQLSTAEDSTNVLMALAPAFPTYAATLYVRDRRRAWFMVTLLTAIAVSPWSDSLATTASGVLYVCTPMLFGFYLAAREMLVRTLTERAEIAEQERDLLADRARTEERVRLAAELHDVVTRRISLMVLHAGALRITAITEATRNAAEHVRAAGCTALAELRDVIGVLRTAATPPEAVPEAEEDQSAGRRAVPVVAPPVDGRDVSVGVVALLLTVTLTLVVAGWHAALAGSWVFPWWELVVQLPTAAVLVLRRRHPQLVTAITLINTVGLLGLALLGPTSVPPAGALVLLVPAATPLATYAVAVHSRRPVVATVSVLALIVVASRPWEPHLSVATIASVFVGLPSVVGLYVAARRRLIAALVERAERASREQRLRADRARASERTRLAEEMHDIVIGSVHDMLARTGPLSAAASTETRAAATDLIDNGRQALDELDELVGALRAADVSSVPEAAEPGEPGLRRLVEESASVGLPAALRVAGNPGLVSPTVARTVHRTIAEALTNVRKHAYGADVLVRVHYEVHRVRVEVRNGRPPRESAHSHRGDPQLAAVGSGTGLLGVRHRVELIEGTLQAGPTEEGGFLVDAILPAQVPTSSPAVEGSHR